MKTIHYHDSGHGMPIVWVHGFPLSSAIFEPQLSIAGYRHIRPDFPGFGATPPAEREPSVGAFAEDVLRVLEIEKLDTAVFAGFSMGGYVVMELFRRAPRLFAGMLLLDTRETPDSDDGRKARMAQIDEVTRTGSTRAVIDAMLPKMALDPALRPRIRAIMESATPAGVVAALRAMASRPDSTDTLRRIDVPTLVVVGDRDEITPPSDAERMVTLIRGSELAPIAKAGHMAHFERPEQLNPLISAFLERHVMHHGHAETV